jgi:hypothetical protein
MRGGRDGRKEERKKGRKEERKCKAMTQKA